MARRYPLTKKLSWRFEYLGYRLMEAFLRLIPLSWIDQIGSAVGFLFFYLSPRYRKLAVRNLRIAFGEEEQKTAQDIRLLARQTCQRTIANFLGTLKTTILPTSKVSEHIEFSGLEILNNTLQKGKGAILVLGHMGNWEALNRLHQFLPPDTPAGGIYQPLKNPLVNAHLLKGREQDGSRFFNKRDGFHAPASFIKDGGLLIVVADQKVGKAGTPIPFFNRLSTLSPLPALLARKAGAPVVAAGIETISPGKWRVVFKEIGEQPKTSKIINTLEELIRRSPADYLWLHNRWKLHTRTSLSISARKGKSTTQKTKPLRALLLSTQPIDIVELQAYLNSREPTDLPLEFETLIATNEPQNLPNNKLFPTSQIIAPTSEQLAARIKEIDENKLSNPLEIALILQPNSSLTQGAKLAQLPTIKTNTKNLSLQDFLNSLTASTTPPLNS